MGVRNSRILIPDHSPDIGPSVWAIFFAVTNQTGSQLRILATDLAPPIIGLVNVLIYLRVGLGRSFAPSIDGTAGLTMTTVLVLPTMNEQDHLDTVTANPGTANKA
jgi:hypothetical protein